MAHQLEALYGIRGFAVLLSHASNDGIVLFKWMSFSDGGRYGVFLFFILSAFLLTRQFLESTDSGRITTAALVRYFFRQFVRIYQLVTVATLVYCVLYAKGYVIIPITGEMLIRSLLLLDAAGLFWTVPVEFQYYFILPFVAYLILKAGRIPAIVGGIVFCTAWTFFFPPEYTKNVLPFLPVFIIGSLATQLYKVTNVKAGSNKYPAMYNILSLMFMLSFLILIPGFYNLLFSVNVGRAFFHNQFILFGFLSAGFILMTLESNGIARWLMESRFFVFWGKVSFSAYLGHKIVLALVYELYLLSSSVQFLLFFAVTALCSYLSYRFFECPLSKIKCPGNEYALISA